MFPGILLTVSAEVIALIIYTMTMERLQHIATLKLIGAPGRVIIGLIAQQALALGVVGPTPGLALILTVKDYFPRRVLRNPVHALVPTETMLVARVLVWIPSARGTEGGHRHRLGGAGCLMTAAG